MMPEEIQQIPGTTAHCYSLSLSGTNILIDTGMKSSAKKIIAFYEGKKIRPDAVLITHYHPDHVGGLSQIVNAFSPEVYAPDEEIPVISGKEKIKPAASIISKIVARMAKIDPVQGIKPVSSLSIHGISAVSTHGHTPGSVSYFVDKLGAIFVGDALMKKGSEITINRAFTLDYSEALRSKEKILTMKPRIILPGHGPSIQFS